MSQFLVTRTVSTLTLLHLTTYLKGSVTISAPSIYKQLAIPIPFRVSRASLPSWIMDVLMASTMRVGQMLLWLAISVSLTETIGSTSLATLKEMSIGVMSPVLVLCAVVFKVILFSLQQEFA
jgi:hypothetical protein